MTGVAQWGCLCLWETSCLTCHGPGGTCGGPGHPTGGGRGAQAPLGGLSQPCPPTSLRAAVRAAAAHPPLPQGSLLQDTGGHCSGGRPGQQSAFVAGVWGCHWWPGVGGEGTAGPGGERGAQGWRCGWKIPEPGGPASSLVGQHRAHAPVGREPGAPWFLMAGRGWTVHLGTDASETWWEVGGAPLSRLVTPPAVMWG